MADGINPPVNAPNATAPPAPRAPTRKRFTQAEFHAIIAAGIIEEGARVELIGGEIIDMAGEGYVHGNGQDMLWRVLASILPPGFEAMTGRPLNIDAETELYPDILVQRVGALGQERSPETVALLVEVADTSLARDRDIKGPRYAAAGFKEFWIYEPAHRRIWVHRDPMADGRWGQVFKREGEETVAAWVAPDRAIAIPVVPSPTEGDGQ